MFVFSFENNIRKTGNTNHFFIRDEKQISISITMTQLYFVKLWRFQQKQIRISENLP